MVVFHLEVSRRDTRHPSRGSWELR